MGAARRTAISWGHLTFFVVLFVPSLLIGVLLFQPLLISSRNNGLLNDAIQKVEAHALATNMSILTLTSAESTKLLTEKTPSVIVYYASWCPHCQHFVPQFLELAEEALRGDPKNTQKQQPPQPPPHPNVIFGTVDCASLRELCEESKVEMYPTVIARYIMSGDNCIFCD
jgi:thiol-disulfide isomerase/thioredoxin